MKKDKKQCPFALYPLTLRLPGKQRGARLPCMEESCALWIKATIDDHIVINGCAVSLFIYSTVKGVKPHE